ncbi:TonB family protein [Dyadobacter sp. LHD-138]|uniref:TonB family protein n=1 Tax=Dyadobacter sp. LHD-138 TaxID=3071413 RepID=UPI0027DFFAC6|nr:TonB family protein [Dyadobacter sp. LHD-138]MDQ6477597.1 TonB family protein [Dyadobacter sp. LHD-138]
METLIYLGKVNVYWILFYACYWLLFRKHTFFVWNRFYLLGSLLVSFALPLIHFPDNARVLPTAVYAVSAIPIYVSTPESTKLALHWTQFVWAVQIIGAALMLVKLLEGFRDLFRLIGQGDEIPMEDHTLVLLPHNEIGSFSFLKWLVVNRADYEKHFDPILRHEAVHIRQLHSLDILLAELLKIFFWFNPVIWFYKRSLQEVHEFLADEEAPNRDHYANFLVSYALSAPVASLTNHFFNSSMLKKRIVMIYKNRNSDWALGKYFLILPLIGLVVMLTGARERLLDAVERKDYKILSAKNIPVEGTVRDESGKPVKAASVVVKGTTKGTSTDQNGRFKFADIAIGSTLIISHINFDPFAIEVNGSVALDQIVLRKKDNMLSEVTVQSYVRKKDTPETESQNGKFTVVEREPQFPGGIEGLGKFLSSTIIYPSEAAKDHVQGKVFVSFTVNENGFVRDPHIIKGIGAGLDEEALRVVLKMPRWEPGKQGGEAIAVQYSLPINFQIAPETEKKPAKFYNYSTPSNQQGFNQTQDLKSGQGKAVGYGAETISSGGQYAASYKALPIGTTQNLQSAAGTKISIKGTENLTAFNKPLVVIDGKIEENANLDKILDTENIQSINVLKGASATSVYGLKGTNGVIIINSKKK